MAKSQRVKDLEKIIPALDKAFYKGDDCVNPLTQEIVTDNEYDALRAELLKLYPKSKIFKTVTISKIKSKLPKIRHNPPMTSINKCNGPDEEKSSILHKWMEECRKIDPDISGQKSLTGWQESFFCMSYKHDGLALSVEYKKGERVRAGLRSDSGKDGIDVTDKTRYIDGMPDTLPLPLTCVIRGEVETTVTEFNNQCDLLGDDAKANPRSHTAGSMGKKTAEEMKDRGLRFVVYNILQLKNPPYKTEIERAKWAVSTLGLNFVKTIPFSHKMLETFEKQHRRLDFPVDGAVLSVDNLTLQEDCGTNGDKDTGNPKGKLAFKFKDEVKKSVVSNIVWQTGRTGNVTPVLIIDPLQLEGTTVTKCTAHNVGLIKKNKIGIGSEVEIIKSGKIIPKLHKVVKAWGKVRYPNICPSCDEPVAIVSGSDGTEALVCSNGSTCPAQNIKNLNHYLKVLGVKGIASSTISKLMECGLVQKRSDFYTSDYARLINSGFTSRTAALIVSRICMIPDAEQEKDNVKLLNQASKNLKARIKVPMEKFIASFGMDGAGKEVGRILSKKYKDFKRIRNLSITELESNDGIGPKTAKSVFEFLRDNKDEIDSLLLWVRLEAPAGQSGVLNSKKFVLSGSLDMGKNYWRGEIENNGGEVKSSVGRKVDYLVAGPGSGSKSDKANELGIPILDEEALETMLKG